MKLHPSKLSAILAISLLTYVPTFAQAVKEKAESKISKTSEKATKATKKADENTKANYPIYGQLVSLTSKTLIIRSSEEKPERKFLISKDSEIVKDGKPATAEDAKVGQWVGGYVEKNASGNDKLLKLNLSAKQREANAPKSAGKERKKKGEAAPKTT